MASRKHTDRTRSSTKPRICQIKISHRLRSAFTLISNQHIYASLQASRHCLRPEKMKASARIKENTHVFARPAVRNPRARGLGIYSIVAHLCGKCKRQKTFESILFRKTNNLAESVGILLAARRYETLRPNHKSDGMSRKEQLRLI